jgi:Sec-independent protein translocase protein TatA
MLFAFGMPSIEWLMIILGIVFVLFGSKRLRRTNKHLKHQVKSFVPLKENNDK